MSENPVRSAALEAMDRGWCVFPVAGKVPATPNGLKDASRDFDRIRAWWELHPGRGLAVATGDKSGVWALDLDGERGREAIRELQERHGGLPETVTSRTARGFHLFFRLPEGVTVRNSAGKVAPGIDVRGGGGYVVLPPSPHPSGTAYEWVSGRSPDDLVPASAPDWLLHAVQAHAENGDRPRAAPIPDQILKGQRNHTLASLAGSYRERGSSRDAMAAALHVENQQRCIPPLADDEVERIADSISRYEPTGQSHPAAVLLNQGDEKRPSRKIPEPIGVSDLLSIEESGERFLVDQLIEEDSNILMAAAPKSHKTNMALHLGVCAAAGRSFLGAFRVPEPLRCGLILMEDRQHRVRRRIERIANSEGVQPESLGGRLHFWFRPPLRLGDAAAIRELGDYVESLDLDLLVVDSWSYVSAGDSNSADEVTPQLMALSGLRDRRPGLVNLLVVHAGKHQEHRGDRVTDIIRGSGAFGAWYDTGILLTRKDEQTPVTVRVEHRDLPAPEPFAFTVEDEFAGPPPMGYLRLRRADKSADQLALEKDAERVTYPLLVKLLEHPAGVSRRGLRDLVPEESWRVVETAFEILKSRGEADMTPAPRKGIPANYFPTVPGVP